MFSCYKASHCSAPAESTKVAVTRLRFFKARCIRGSKWQTQAVLKRTPNKQEILFTLCKSGIALEQNSSPTRGLLQIEEAKLLKKSESNLHLFLAQIKESEDS